MADVFISYSRENEAVVRGLAQAVAGEGYSVWWDEALPPHLSYGDVIAGEIGKARAVIVVWSETAIASEWVRAEADLARNQKKLVQTSIDGRMPPMPFNQLHFVSIAGWHGEGDHPGWTRVKESLAFLCRGEVAQPAYAFPATAPPRPAPRAGPAFRLALMLVGGLILLGGAGAAGLWLIGGGTPATVEATPPARSQGTAPQLSAPVEAPRPASRPSAAASRPAAPAPARAQPDKPQTAPVRQTQMSAANMRRYCSGPGRATLQCRQFRTRMSQPR